MRDLQIDPWVHEAVASVLRGKEQKEWGWHRRRKPQTALEPLALRGGGKLGERVRDYNRGVRWCSRALRPFWLPHLARWARC